ncbi:MULTISPECIES: HlyD family efflux transporter periplasmic adaptor subunit [Priestia]|uniref:HlyD family efflux transporter periplasmic adaptor subunit n=1 Tax=Priestia aryabhattai TaxID=412384 RepID=A0ABD7WZP5_PRIAR|nr:HlyD family efflux transporter periplasmic adaptor subunit [Priestia aryabhattai]KML31682.1 transporter [Priestia aryabhattai]KMN94859.1 transporter [Priestia aryabhattai]MCQ9284893.1 HlyD family efflux transporter periplasmic adaptor subunit [Priestia aryabhattai]MED4392137.1 HlyD family efflux transporter periplasmic adaptor subunit [Priestia aryabhattai]PEI55207.1 transporter [Priestia aryabhattai]
MSRSRLMVTNFIGIIVILALLIGGGYYYVQKSNYITTDNAKVSGDVYNVVAPAAGKVASWTVEEGNDVSKDAEIAKIQAEKGSVAATVPADGKIIQTNVKENQMVQAGQQIATEVDMKDLFIVANIKEDQLKDIKEGDDVDVTVDGDSGTKIDGKVEEVGYATNSLSSLTSNSSSDGNYTKVSQTVPVKISISNYSEHVLPGMNAEVKISKD